MSTDIYEAIESYSESYDYIGGYSSDGYLPPGCSDNDPYFDMPNASETETLRTPLNAITTHEGNTKELEMEQAIEAEPDVSTALELVSDIHIARAPQRVIQEAQDAAKALKDILASKKNKFMVRGEQYLQFEDWQTLGRFYGVTAKIKATRQVTYGDASGFEATAEAMRADGLVISAAEAMCMDDEANWRGKPIFQLRSMAQTRACAKALRNVLSWVAVLAGYSGTPAEEMDHAEYEVKQPSPNCPECGGQMWDNRESKRNPRAPDFKCKDKSCKGAIWPEQEEKKTSDQALRDDLFNAAEKLLAGMDADKRKEALGRLLLLDTETMAIKINELAERMRAKTATSKSADKDAETEAKAQAELERQARLKTIRGDFDVETVEKYLESKGWISLEKLSLDQLDEMHGDLIPF